MGWQDTDYQKARKKIKSKTETTIKREIKKYAKKNYGFLIALAIVIVVGFVAGYMLNTAVVCKDDKFVLYENDATYNGDVIQIESGNSYDLISNTSYEVVGFGKELTKYVKFYVKYLKDEESDLEDFNGTTFTNDGTYYVIYYLAYSGDDFSEKLGAFKYENTKFRKTVVIGGESNG